MLSGKCANCNEELTKMELKALVKEFMERMKLPPSVRD
jgi:hypothetical protein